MGKQRIKITQLFNAPIENVFDTLTGHESFGRVINIKITRVVDAPGENKNGAGSVRRIRIAPFVSFEESVITFEPGRLMEYVISKGSPIKNHKGRMEFTGDNGKTRLDYIIDFEPKQPFFFAGGIIKIVLEKSMQKGLKNLAAEYEK